MVWSLLLVCVLFCLLSLPHARPALAADKGDMRAQPLFGGQRSLDGAKATQGLPAVLGMGEAVHRALQYNPGLGAREAQSRAADEGRKSARGAFGPKLGMAYSVTKQERESTPASRRPPELGTYSWGVEVSQPVFQGFRLLARYQKAALQADHDKAALRQAELAMTESVQTVFLDYLRSGENVRSQQEALSRLREQQKITKAFYDVGLRPRLDVLQADVNVSEAESRLITMQNNHNTALARLNTLLGLPANRRQAYEGQLRAVPFTRTLEQCLETAYRQRPDLYMAAKAVEIAGKDRTMVQSEYYPQVEAYYNINQTGNTPDLQKQGDMGSRGTAWEVGARATWNVFQWGATYYADKQAGALVTKMRYEAADLQLQVGYEIKSRLLAVREAEKRMVVAQKGVTQSREAYQVALGRYQEQVGTNFDVLDASAQLTLAQASLTSARADYLTALAQIYRAMGEFHPDLLHP